MSTESNFKTPESLSAALQRLRDSGLTPQQAADTMLLYSRMCVAEREEEAAKALARRYAEKLYAEGFTVNEEHAKEQTILHRALRVYGAEPQIRQLGEECTELATEVFHHMRGRNNMDDLAAEIADVEIMLDQMRLFLPVGIIDLWRSLKLARLNKRLDEEEARRAAEAG